MDVVELCEEMIKIDSSNPFRLEQREEGWWIDGNERELLDFCETYLKNIGFQTFRQPCGGGRENLLAQRGQHEHSILLYGHADTVEVKRGWTPKEALTPRRAFREIAPSQKEEVLYGLGANDMKGGLAVILKTAELTHNKHYTLKIAIGCDEEFFSLGSQCLIEKSNFLDDVIGILVPEIGEHAEEKENAKFLITLGRCGRTQFKISLKGTGGHGAQPYRKDRINAITQAAHLALAIDEYGKKLPSIYPFGKEQPSVRASAFVSQIQGGKGVFSLPEEATLIVDRVLLPGESTQTALEELKELTQQLHERGILKDIKHHEENLSTQVSFLPRPTPFLEAYLIDPEEPFVELIRQTALEHGGYQLGVGVSVADENRFGSIGKTVVVLGPRGENSHAPYEWVSIPSLYALENLYCDILRRLDNTSLTILKFSLSISQ